MILCLLSWGVIEVVSLMRDLNNRTDFTHPSLVEKDILSELIDSLRIDGSAVLLFDLRSPWTIALPYEPAICFTLVEGELWLYSEKGSVQYFSKGDTCILPRGAKGIRYLISSSSTKPTHWVSANDVLTESEIINSVLPDGPIVPQTLSWGGNGSKTVSLMSFIFDWSGKSYGPLIEALPSLIRVDAKDADADQLDLMRRFPFKNGGEKKPGESAIMTMTAQLFLAQVIRTYALISHSDHKGWLRGFTHPKLAKILTALHRKPGRSWTLNAMAVFVGMSKSAFTKEFRDVMGQSPMAYLRSWRVHLAREALAKGEKTIAVLARELGYQSESAFRTAFRKETGQSPREYAKFGKIK